MATSTQTVTIPSPDLRRIDIGLVGLSPLICHRFSEKSRKAMLDKQQKKASKGREAKDPHANYLASLYPLPDGSGYGFPSVAFKAAAVRAGTDVGLKMTDLRRAFHIEGELVPIQGEPRMREDVVRLNGRTADLRYRGEFPEWRTVLPVVYNASVISEEQLLNLLQYAGFGVGCGEWRPEKSGSFGMFRLADANDLAQAA